MSGTAPTTTGWAVIARLGRTHGLQGALYADAWLGAERFAGSPEVWIRRPGQQEPEGKPHRVLRARAMQGRLVLELEGIGSIEQAGRLTGCELVVPENRRAPLGEDEFYLSDLVGCAVYLQATGERAGLVVGWHEFGGPPTLEIDCGGRAVWVPCVRAICTVIDPERRRIVIDPPEGLLELNSAEERP